MAEREPNSIYCYVVDVCGERFLNTFARLDYEAAFRKHARWWIQYRTRPGAHRDTDALGNRLRQPVKPCRIMIEPYFDKTSPD